NYFRMNSIIYECRDDFIFVPSAGGDSLDNTASRIVQLRRIIVIGDLSFCLPYLDLQGGRLKIADGFVYRVCNLFYTPVEVFQIGVRFSAFIGKAVSIRCAMGMRGADQNILRRNTLDQRP